MVLPCPSSKSTLKSLEGVTTMLLEYSALEHSKPIAGCSDSAFGVLGTRIYGSLYRAFTKPLQMRGRVEVETQENGNIGNKHEFCAGFVS